MRGATIVEVGTGRTATLPIALWLLGAQRVYTLDVNPYLRPELVQEDISAMLDDVDRVLATLGDAQVVRSRLSELATSRNDLAGILGTTNVSYLSPGDARRTGLTRGSIDLHISHNVLEHIPADDLRQIADEAAALLCPGGLAIHLVDFSDHFSHSDTTISSVHFLRYSEADWLRIAGNRFMYHNRLRCSDVVSLFENAGLSILEVNSAVDARALAELRSGFPLDVRFVNAPLEGTAIRSAWLVASPSRRNGADACSDLSQSSGER